MFGRGFVCLFGRKSESTFEYCAKNKRREGGRRRRRKRKKEGVGRQEEGGGRRRKRGRERRRDVRLVLSFRCLFLPPFFHWLRCFVVSQETSFIFIFIFGWHSLGRM